MLKIVESMHQLDFQQLKQVHIESNTANAARDYPDRDDALLQSEMDLYDYLRQVFFKTAGARYCLWREGETTVAALRLEPYRDGLLIAALETAPGYRCKGYATKLLQAVLEYLGQGVTVYAHIDRKNGASIAVHKKCGFAIIANFSMFLDGSVSRSYDTYARIFVQS